MRASIRRIAVAMATFACAGISTSRSDAGLTFNFVPAAGTSVQAINGFAAAGALWSNIFDDDITININIAFTPLGAGILGSTSSTQGTVSYANTRNALIADKTSADDTTATNSLQAGPGVKMLLNRTSNNPNGSGSAATYIDNDNDANNTTIRMTSANAKAVGLLAGNNAGLDASISFSSSFNFDFDRSNGVAANAFDFIGVAAHEIGHALGFISGVDVLDGNSPPGAGPFRDDQFTFVSTLDLFRYSTTSAASGAIDWTADNRTKYFSIDGGATNAGATFSTGVRFGDSAQASHWKDSQGLGIMDPTADFGELLSITGNDVRAFDVIGYNLIPASAVPEPATVLSAGFASVSMIFITRRNRNRKAA